MSFTCDSLTTGTRVLATYLGSAPFVATVVDYRRTYWQRDECNVTVILDNDVILPGIRTAPKFSRLILAVHRPTGDALDGAATKVRIAPEGF